MQKLIVYGSLLNEEELQNQGLWGHNVVPVKVFGFKRVFNQEPSYRILKSQERAVLSIEFQNNSWFNGIMIKDLDEAFFEALDMREIGYERIKVECKTYSGDFFNDCFVYLGRNDKKNSEILPNPEYLNLCLEGAKQISEEFYQDFINTTYQQKESEQILINS
jgi:gamma-glutamylcyclotransferase (GGCT)/AIG2-like uncharacterized protein YtfP